MSTNVPPHKTIDICVLDFYNNTNHLLHKKRVTIMKTARLQLIISMAIFGTIGIFTKFIPIPSAEIALFRALLAIVLLTGYLLITKTKFNFKLIKKELPLLALSGAAMGINWVLLFEAYKHTTVSNATLSYYFAPVLVTIVSPILFKEKLTIKQIICFVMSTIGLIMIIGVGGAANGATAGLSSNLKGIFFGLGAACFYATVILLNKCVKSVAGIQRTFLQFIAAIIVLFPYVLLSGPMQVGTLSAAGLAHLLVVGLVHTGITYCLYFSSLKDLPGQEVAILSYIDPLVAVIASAVFLNETFTVLQIVGGLLIIGFSIWNEK